MKKILDVGKFVLLAFLLTFVMGIIPVFVGIYAGATGTSIGSLLNNKIVAIIELIGEVTLPLFLFVLYKRNKKEFNVIMPFPKENRLIKYFLGYILGALLFLIIWFLSVSFGGIRVINVWSIPNASLLILFFLGYGIQGMAEEIVCRGYLQGRLMQITNKK